jgi:tRNA(fMet)-specific endonuclease VapC
MSGASGLLLLDTNIVIHLVRGGAVAQAIDGRFQLRARPERPLISVVTLGEAMAFSRYQNWGLERIARLKELLRELVPVGISSQPVLDRYAEISAFLTRSGRSVSDNDVWIAACASATAATLLTTDRDFDPLVGQYLDRVWIDPRRRVRRRVVRVAVHRVLVHRQQREPGAVGFGDRPARPVREHLADRELLEVPSVRHQPASSVAASR